MSKVLLVEDNALNRDMLARRLRRRGYEVVEAEDGQQALRRALLDAPDLVLMDLSLPGLDGLETTQLLRATPATAALPVIALTAHAMETDRARALSMGCDDFDSKPVELDRLLAKIERLLPRRRFPEPPAR
jgi:CheY-like chemotaxis protein